LKGSDAVTPKDVQKMFRDALDGIELLDNTGCEEVIIWAKTMRDVGMWGVPGTEVMLGIHNKCKSAEPGWQKHGFFVA
jgi:hypothetical protein